MAGRLLHVGHIFPTPDIWNCVVKNPSSCSIFKGLPHRLVLLEGPWYTFVPGGPKDAPVRNCVATLLPLKNKKTVLTFTEISMKSRRGFRGDLRPRETENRAEKTLKVD